MLRLAQELRGYTVFYNGARCGASAPDHFHFQAGNSDFLPLAANLDGVEMKKLLTHHDSTLYLVDSLPIKMFVIDAATPAEGNVLSIALLNAMVPRKRHRPSFYGTEGDDCMLLSPASVDMGGVFITPRLCDFERFDTGSIRRVIDELCLNDQEINSIAEKLLDTHGA